jgi:hypothetical protein
MLRTVWLIAILGTLACAGAAVGFSTGPPDGATGAPGEFTCADCHGNLNVGDGTMTVTAPTSYAPGDTIDVSLKVEQEGQVRWGFELTVLDAADLPVGDIIVTEPTRTQLSIGGVTFRQYLKHTALGTDLGTPDESPGWSFKWASPAVDPGPVTFYIAGNAANGDGSSSGDFIYTSVFMYDDSHSFIVDEEATWGMIKSLYR